jgi:hypothetical protein
VAAGFMVVRSGGVSAYRLDSIDGCIVGVPGPAQPAVGTVFWGRIWLEHDMEYAAKGRLGFGFGWFLVIFVPICACRDVSEIL